MWLSGSPTPQHTDSHPCTSTRPFFFNFPLAEGQHPSQYGNLNQVHLENRLSILPLLNPILFLSNVKMWEAENPLFGNDKNSPCGFHSCFRPFSFIDKRHSFIGTDLNKLGNHDKQKDGHRNSLEILLRNASPTSVGVPNMRTQGIFVFSNDVVC